MGSDSSANMNEGNIAVPEPERIGAEAVGRRAVEMAPRLIHLAIEENLRASLSDRIPAQFHVLLMDEFDPAALVDSLSSGDCLLWIGDGSRIPAELWIGTFRPADSDLASAVAGGSPLVIGDLPLRATALASAFIKPVKDMLQHNIDEELRADFIPILEAKDRFGRVVGYPGVLMSHYGPSLVGRRFQGSDMFFFLFDRPIEALEAEAWIYLLEGIAARFQSALQLGRIETDYASYQPGERVHVRARIANWRPVAASSEIVFYAKAPDEAEFRRIASHRRCPDAHSISEAVCDFPINGTPGLWTIRVEACQDLSKAEELSLPGNPAPVDRREIGVIMLDGEIKTPSLMEIDGPRILLDGQDSFWAGTHYYPSSSWWEWLWRDFRPLTADRDFAGIRSTGYRIVRIWIDPVLDEQTLRAMDAAIWLAAQHGIILDVCIFTQWVRTIGFERPNGEQVTWDFKHRGDGNIYSISLRSMALQKEYAALLAKRWKDAGNVFYNLANETYIKDPDETQMDPGVSRWPGIPKENGTLRDSLIFRRWANEITGAMREAGGKQPIMPGYMFSLSSGGDSYVGNRDAEFSCWHCYAPGVDGPAATFFDSACSDRPLIIEEFGALGWNSIQSYDNTAHIALAAGASVAMSYEWGVSWLTPEMPFSPTPLRDAAYEESDERWFQPYIDTGKLWPSKSVGICVTPSGFGYGSIYNGTPFPAEAAVALGRLGRMGQGLGRAVRPGAVYVLAPNAKNDNMDSFFTTVRRLWRGKVAFQSWQEDCLGLLPDSARILICPDGVTLSESAGRLDALRESGVQVFMGSDDGWKAAPDLTRLVVDPMDDIDLIARQTVQGTLYVLTSDQPTQTVTMNTQGGTSAGLGLDRFAMVHDREAGVGMVEASGDVTINGKRFCTIASGRAIIASDDDCDMLGAGRLRILATEPCRIRFSREVDVVALLEEGVSTPIAAFQINSRTLDIDSEMVRYVLRITFSGG